MRFRAVSPRRIPWPRAHRGPTTLIGLAVDLEPDEARFRLRLAQCQNDAGHYEESRANFERTAQVDDPTWMEGWSLASLAFHSARSGDFADVLGLVRAAWETGTASNWAPRVYMLGPLVLLSAATEDEAPMLEARELLAQWTPSSADTHNRLAWIIVTNVARVEQAAPPDRPIAATARRMLLDHAIELAQVAVDHAPSEPDAWNTLGQALYQAGDPEGAVAALRKEYELRGEGDAVNRLCLAMAQQALGDDDVARAWYARAIDWMAANETDEQLQWYRAEAARVLGME